MDSVKAHTSMGESGSGLIMNDQKIRAVFRKTDLVDYERDKWVYVKNNSRSCYVVTGTYSPSEAK